MQLFWKYGFIYTKSAVAPATRAEVQ